VTVADRLLAHRSAAPGDPQIPPRRPLPTPTPLPRFLRHASIPSVELSDSDPRPGRVTIRQVAELAGVSIATVSRVANGRSDVSVETRDAVRRVIREHGYLAGPRSRPEQAAGLIRIMVPEVHSNYFAEIVSGASEALFEHGLRVELCPVRHPRAPAASLPDRLADGVAEGAILVLPDRPDEELEALAGRGFPFVIVDPGTEIAEGIPVVCAAHASGATQATAHLLELGHRRIGAIGGPEGRLATHERVRGYHAALAGAGVLPDPALFRYSDFNVEGGRKEADWLLSLPDPPTAIFAFNDAMAIGAIQALAVRGLKVPADVSVVGFDDTFQAAIAVPALTTVRQPLAEQGRTAVSLLLRQIENRRLEPLRLELATRLVVRDSTAPRA
jgi:LacI family transcriptional regulator